MACGEGAEDVAQYFEKECDGEGTQVKCSVAEDLVGVQSEGNGEEKDCE